MAFIILMQFVQCTVFSMLAVHGLIRCSHTMPMLCSPDFASSITIAHCTHPPELRRPFSYSHLLFSPTVDLFADVGLGVVVGPFRKRFDPEAEPRGLGDPRDPSDDRLPPNPPLIAFCSNGLPFCAYGEPEPEPPTFPDIAWLGLPFAERGDPV